MKRLNRRSVLFGVLALALLPQLTTAAAARVPRVLFVCQSGTVKSAIAREILRHRAKERHIAVEVASRGIRPEQHLTPELVARLAKDSINPGTEPVKKLAAGDIAAADLVVAFDKLPKEYQPRHLEDWSDLPSIVNDYEHARLVLDHHIEMLLDHLPAR